MRLIYPSLDKGKVAIVIKFTLKSCTSTLLLNQEPQLNQLKYRKSQILLLFPTPNAL